MLVLKGRREPPLFFSGAGFGIMVYSFPNLQSSLMKRIALLACTGLFVLGLVACGDKGAPEPASKAAIERQTSDPARAVEAFAAQLREDNLLAAVQLAVPPANLEELRAQWTQKMAEDAPSDEERAEYAQQMAKFTAPDAEQALYAELEPMLVKYETEMAAQMPMMIGMGQGFATQAINANEDLDEVQKKQATEVVSALGGWLQGVNLADRELARKSIAIAVKTARALELPTLDAVRALDFDQTMGKGGLVFSGAKEILALYGLDINQSLASTKATVVSKDDGAAQVDVAYSLLGKNLNTRTEMVEVDGRWYGKDTIEQLVSGLAGGAAADADDDHADHDVASDDASGTGHETPAQAGNPDDEPAAPQE